jgi:transcriptional regulator with XRE-family HTH domain
MWVEQLGARREQKALSLRQSGLLAGLSPQTVQGIESGTTQRPRIDVVARHARAVGGRLVLTPRRPASAVPRRARPALPVPAPAGAAVTGLPREALLDLQLIGAELRWARRDQGMRRTRRDVASAAGVSEATVRRLESDDWPHPRIDKLQRVALELAYELIIEDADAPWRLRPWQQLGTSARTRVALPSRAYMPAAVTELWNTPRDLMEQLREEFGDFALDVAALSSSSVATQYLGPDHPDPRRRDALAFQHWADLAPQGGPLFCNPPYGALLPDFTRLAAETAARGVTTVALLPVRSSARFWHDHVLQPGVEVRYLRGRLKFVDSNGQSENAAPFASALVIFRGNSQADELDDAIA